MLRDKYSFTYAIFLSRSINFGPYAFRGGVQSVDWAASISLSVAELSSLAAQTATTTLFLKSIVERHARQDPDHVK